MSSLRVLPAPMRTPVTTGHGTIEYRELLVLELRDPDSGLHGLGEAAPLESYDGVSMPAVIDALRDCFEVLRPFRASMAIDPEERAALLAECDRRAVLPQALAAVDLALWDLAGRAAGKPLWQLLDPHGMPPAPIAVNYTIAASDRAGAATEAARAREQGFETLKLKVGTGDDAGRVAAVRAAAGPAMRIRLDANGAWTVPEAIRWLEVLAPAGIELCEEPVHGLAEIAEVASATSVPIAIDESAVDPGTFHDRHADAVCLKIARAGGITGVLAKARAARELGYAVYLASTFDGPLGIAAALHAAAVIEPDHASGLATLRLFDREPDPLPASGGAIAPPTAAGLGPGELGAWYDIP